MISILLSYLTLFGSFSEAFLIPRSSTTTCTNIRANSDNGNRKIGIVIDVSGSMSESDPYNLRAPASRSVLDWLISKNESTSTKPQDLVTVITFDDQAYIDYPLGDPAGAYSSLSQIGDFGGTYIAGGVQAAIEQITADGTGITANRSGIIVFTDGEDDEISPLVDQINDAASKGIRVAFGFLDSTSSIQDPNVLSAIMNSGGRYFTVPDYKDIQTFINGIIVNGLTTNDNPQGDTTTLYAGLDASQFISDSQTQTMTYNARSSESLTFDIESVNAGDLSVQIVSNGKVLGTGTASNDSLSISSGLSLLVTAHSAEAIDVKVTATNAPKDSIFVVSVTSSLPPENCKVGVGSAPSSNSKIVKIVVPPVVIFITLLTTAGGWWLYKHYHGNHPGNHGPVEVHPPPPYVPGGEKLVPTQVVQSVAPPKTNSTPWFKFPSHNPPSVVPPPAKPPMSRNVKPQNETREEEDSMSDDSGSDVSDDDNLEEQQNYTPQNSQDNKHRHPRRRKTYSDNHHHHIGPQHPCYNQNCPLVSHICENSGYPCTCVDPKCKLNSRRHKCANENVLHTCEGPEHDPACPLNDPEYARQKKAERDGLIRKYKAEAIAKRGLKKAAKHAIDVTTSGLIG